MANIPHFFNRTTSTFEVGSSSSAPPIINPRTPLASTFEVGSSSSGPTVSADNDLRLKFFIFQLILDLSNSDLRENALQQLSKKREVLQDFAKLIWNSFGTVAALLQEILSVYPIVSSPTLSVNQTNRVCNAIALLKCVASHPETKMLFLNAHIPLYLYPFLHNTTKTRQTEFLRLTSLGVIGALVKVDDPEVIKFLLSTEIVPLCLLSMEVGSDLSKTVATFILQKILLDDLGLEYVCTPTERFFAVSKVLSCTVASVTERSPSQLLKHIIRCYLRLSENPRACSALRKCLPGLLRDATLISVFRDDPVARAWLQQLLYTVQQGSWVHSQYYPMMVNYVA